MKFRIIMKKKKRKSKDQSSLSPWGEGRGEGPPPDQTMQEFPSPNLSPQRHLTTKHIRSGERDRRFGLPCS